MVKVKKKNVSYMITEDQIKRFLSMGFVIVEEHVPKKIIKPIIEKSEDVIVEEVVEELKQVESKPIYRMKKVELIDLAAIKGINLTGEESINDLRKLLK